MNKKIALLSVSAASVLALSACGGNGNGGANGEVSEEELEDVPALSEIEETMWDSMESSESVTIIAAPEDLDADELEQMGLQFNNATFYGNLDGSASAFAFGEDEATDAVVVFGDEGYMSVDFMFSLFSGMMAGQAPDEEQELIDGVASELEGYWIDQSEEYDPENDPFSVEAVLSEARDSWFDDTGEITSEAYGEEGELDERDGEPVWIYSDGDSELVVEANPDAPRILEATEGEDSVTFSDWDSTEAPERPAGDEIIDEEDFDQLLQEAAEEQGLG